MCISQTGDAREGPVLPRPSRPHPPVTPGVYPSCLGGHASLRPYVPRPPPSGLWYREGSLIPRRRVVGPRGPTTGPRESRPCRGGPRVRKEGSQSRRWCGGCVLGGENSRKESTTVKNCGTTEPRDQRRCGLDSKDSGTRTILSVLSECPLCLPRRTFLSGQTKSNSPVSEVPSPRTFLNLFMVY